MVPGETAQPSEPAGGVAPLSGAEELAEAAAAPLVEPDAGTVDDATAAPPDGSLGSVELLADALGSVELLADALGSVELLADALGSVELLSDTLGSVELDVESEADVPVSADVAVASAGGVDVSPDVSLDDTLAAAV
jgi:hypothetical protein